MKRRACAPSVFPGLHGAMQNVPSLDSDDLQFTAQDLEQWFDRVDGGLPAVHPFVDRTTHGVAHVTASAEAATFTGGAVLSPEAVFTAAGGMSGGVVSATGGTTASGAAAAGLAPSVAAAAKRLKGSGEPITFTPNPASRASVFLRTYFGITGPSLFVEAAHFREVVDFCSRNDPHFTYAVQQLSVQFHAGLLDPGTLPTSTAGRNAIFAVGALPAAAELRKAYNEYCNSAKVSASSVASAAPRVSVSQSHFVFRVGDDDGAGASDDDDAYFSAQVTVTNIGRSSTQLRITQQAYGEDGNLVFPGAAPESPSATAAGAGQASAADVDYHASVDRDVLKRGDAARISLSAIVKGTAEFGRSEFACCVAVGPPEATLKVFVTAVLVNPHGAVFRVPPPLCCTTIVHTPLGTYRVPVVLATLLAVFAARQGFTCTAKSVTPFADTPDDLQAVYDAKDALDELGHAPFLKSVKTSELPLQLALLGPQQLLSLMVLWLTEYPEPVIPASISSSNDAARFLADVLPSDTHGIVLAVVDVCARAATAPESPPVALLVATFAEAMATATTNLLLGRVGGADQMTAAADLLRATMDHLAAWVTAAAPLYAAGGAKGSGSKAGGPSS